MAALLTQLRGLAQSLRETLHSYLLPEARPTGRVLGTGAYGSVEEVEVNGTICAGKKIHETLLDGGNFGAHVIARKYADECQLMTEIRHPNVVQFLGVCFPGGSALPLLVMERLEMSLDDLLETTPNIPLTIKTSVLEGTACGLLYLHKQDPPIIHRDLTAKNILLTSSLEAKITDFGNSRLVDLQPGRLGALTRLPGTLVYMPPEALEARARYDGPSLDVFSFGHCALFTCTQVFPGDLKSSTYPEPTNVERMLARSEVERREEYISQLEQQLTGDRQHPLATLITQCLHDAPHRRPTTEGLVEQLRMVRASVEGPYCGGVVSKLDVARVGMIRAVRSSELQVQAVQQQMAQLELNKDAAEARAESQLTALREKNTQIDHLQREVRENHGEIRLKDIQLHQLRVTTGNQLAAKTAEIDQLQRSCELLRAEVARQEGLLTRHEAELALLTSRLEGLQHLATHGSKLSLKFPLKWKRLRDLPFEMCGNPCSVVLKAKLCVGGGVTNQVAKDECTVIVYDLNSNEWSKLREYGFGFFSMAVVNGELVMIGGMDPASKTMTNKIGVWDEDSQHWMYPYHPMPSACARPAVVVYNHYLIVAGGGGDDGAFLTQVQILDVRTKDWCNSAPLPEGCKQMTSAVVGDVWYLTGGFTLSGRNQVVFTASLPALISGAVSSPSATVAHSSHTDNVWSTLTDAPLMYSHALSLQESLLVLGGRDHNADLRRSSAIYYYQHSTWSWVKVGDLPSKRCFCACYVLPSGQVLVAGGGGGPNRLDMATVSYIVTAKLICLSDVCLFLHCSSVTDNTSWIDTVTGMVTISWC